MKVPGFDFGPADFSRALKASSFAPAALVLNSKRRKDLEIFYAFCRVVDDCADEYAPAEGRRFLKAWQKALAKAPSPTAPLLQRELWRLSAEYGIPLGLFRDLVLGALSDLRPRVRFARQLDLNRYIHRVAGVVGQACLPLFGVELKAGRAYAEALGRAFQLINIVRDAKEDAARGRLYFCLEDLRKQGLSEKKALAGRGMQPVLLDYALRAQAALREAERASAGLPKSGLRPSRMMRKVYGALLDAMLADGLKVFEKRYSLSGPKKFWLVFTGLL
jgi:phytoene/squalene synthetase